MSDKGISEKEKFRLRIKLARLNRAIDSLEKSLCSEESKVRDSTLNKMLITKLNNFRNMRANTYIELGYDLEIIKDFL